MSASLTNLAYLVSAGLFVFGLKRLQSPVTARGGNQLAGAGMLLAIVVTLLDRQMVGYGVIVAGLVAGGAIGGLAARWVPMTAMPETVAAFNGFGGGASALVAAAELLRGRAVDTETILTILLSTLIGSLTFSGSLVAFAKLQGLLPGRPVIYPGQNLVNGGVALGALALSAWVLGNGSPAGFVGVTLLALVLGVGIVLPIGGADMPVVISLLNSYSGLAAAATGFAIENSALVIGGALVGASGLILSNLMCRAMNRSLANVLFGAFGSREAATAGPGMGADGVRVTNAEEVAINLAYARSVVVVPGYGLAVAQAQHALRDLELVLESRGVDVRYAIHPVAGRMPGHMNVLLAEADVPYDKLYEPETINPDLPRADVALVVGANDVVNPAARDPGSPIYGMPILDVDRAKTAVVIKRS
ncbi:MAG: NAD(P)(+) transhydrogenase (Re/Si-specific) subunit beta, partial [Acidimicrobiia bacterium]